MRLSEAIRLGAMLRPQTFEALRDEVGTCALGAAEDAVGGADWCGVWSNHKSISAVCPVCLRSEMERAGRGEYLATPAHLNDKHRWTREQIADWIESIEGEQEQTAAPSPKESTCTHSWSGSAPSSSGAVPAAGNENGRVSVSAEHAATATTA